MCEEIALVQGCGLSIIDLPGVCVCVVLSPISVTMLPQEMRAPYVVAGAILLGVTILIVIHTDLSPGLATNFCQTAIDINKPARPSQDSGSLRHSLHLGVYNRSRQEAGGKRVPLDMVPLDPRVKERFQKISSESIRQDDPDLIQFIRDEMLDPPRPFISKLSAVLYRTPQAEEVDWILKGKVTSQLSCVSYEPVYFVFHTTLFNLNSTMPTDVT